MDLVQMDPVQMDLVQARFLRSGESSLALFAGSVRSVMLALTSLNRIFIGKLGWLATGMPIRHCPLEWWHTRLMLIIRV